MKQNLTGLVLICIAFAVGVGATALLKTHAGDVSGEEMRRLLESRDTTEDVLPAGFTLISDTVALRLRNNRAGQLRATVMVKSRLTINGRVVREWEPVPVDGSMEIGPGVMPSQ